MTTAVTAQETATDKEIISKGKHYIYILGHMLGAVLIFVLIKIVFSQVSNLILISCQQILVIYLLLDLFIIVE